MTQVHIIIGGRRSSYSSMSTALDSVRDTILDDILERDIIAFIKLIFLVR